MDSRNSSSGFWSSPGFELPVAPCHPSTAPESSSSAWGGRYRRRGRAPGRAAACRSRADGRMRTGINFSTPWTVPAGNSTRLRVVKDPAEEAPFDDGDPRGSGQRRRRTGRPAEAAHRRATIVMPLMNGPGYDDGLIELLGTNRVLTGRIYTATEQSNRSIPRASARFIELATPPGSQRIDGRGPVRPPARRGRSGPSNRRSSACRGGSSRTTCPSARWNGSIRTVISTGSSRIPPTWSWWRTSRG